MSQQLPEHASVIVIGGGVMGCSTLYHLAEAGVSDAIVLERNQLTSGTTWHSAAQVRALRSTRNLTDLIRYSVDLYSRLEEETGQSVGWIQKGSLSIATNHDRMIHVKRQQSLARLFGVQADSVRPEEALERWPLMNVDDVLGAVWSPDDGRVSPSDLCAALVKGAKSRGAKIFENTGVTGILTENNKVVGVETDQGTVRCDAIALCTGLWSKKAAAMGGVEIPVWPCEHFYLLTKPVDGIQGNMPTLSDHDGHLYIRDDSGGLLVGCFEPMGKAIDPERLGEDFAFGLLDEDWDHFEPMMENALHRLPILAESEVKMLLNGPESFTPDGSFLLGETGETQGLFLGCGMNSVGVATGGGAGMALAHCILHGAPPTDLHEADPQRFPDCFNSAAALAERVPEVLGKHYEITYPGRQWETSRNLQQLPLQSRWESDGAYFGQVAGYERAQYFGCNEHPKLKEPILTFGKPAWFDQVGREVKQANKGAALFDQSTFGKIDVTGADARQFLNRICANQMDRAVGKAIYTAMLNERGGIISDLTAIRIATDHYRLFVGTAARKRDMNWLQRHLDPSEDITLTDKTDDLMIIGLMGPDSKRIVTEIGADSLNNVPYFGIGEATIAGKHVLATRLSYVGEAGWEMTCNREEAGVIYDALYQAGARPAGLLAQTAMRIEKGYLAYGHDLDTDISPLEAGLEFAVNWETDFIGKEALLGRKSKPLRQRIISILLDDIDAVPLGNEPVIYQGKMCGKTSSAGFGYRVGRPIAIALVDNEIVGAGDSLIVEVDIAGELFSGKTVLGAVFDPTGERMRQ
jgi:4-methylaminobutanoate oxidase (formaldehyde-forming)